MNNGNSNDLEWPSKSFTCCKPFQMEFLVHLCSSWQYFNWHSASQASCFITHFRVFSCIFFCNFLYFSLRYGFKCKCNHISSPRYVLCAHWDDKPVQSFTHYLRQGAWRRLCFRRCLSVCLSVSNFAQKLPNGFAWNIQGRLANEQLIKFWWRYGSGSGYGPDPNTGPDPDPWSDTGKTCLGRGMHCPSASSWLCNSRHPVQWANIMKKYSGFFFHSQSHSLTTNP